VLVKIKTHEVGPQTVSGLQAGIEKCRNQFDEEARGIIVAPSVFEKAKAMIQGTDVKHVNLYSVINPST